MVKYKTSEDFIPSISNQGFVKYDIPNRRLSPSNNVKFNGSIIRHKGEILLAYRRYDPEHGRTSIAITKLDENFEPKSHHRCNLDSRFNKPVQEDCRLFHYLGNLYISWTDLDWEGWKFYGKARISQMYSHLVFDGDEYHSYKSLMPDYGGNHNEVEKNWTFFDHRRELYFVYNINNHEIVSPDWSTGSIQESRKSEDLIYYPYGHIRGGSPPVYSERFVGYLSFFHGSTKNAWLGRRYYMGAIVIDPDRLKISFISKSPIIYGTSQEPFCGAGNGRCVFPMGHYWDEKRESYVVSCGINDTFNSIIMIKPEDIEKDMVSSNRFLEPDIRYFRITGRKAGYRSLEGLSTNWKIVKNSGIEGESYVAEVVDPFAIQDLRKNKDAVEISKDEYRSWIKPTQKKQERGKHFFKKVFD